MSTSFTQKKKETGAKDKTQTTRRGGGCGRQEVAALAGRLLWPNTEHPTLTQASYYKLLCADSEDGRDAVSAAQGQFT